MAWVAYEIAVENITSERYAVGRAIGAHNALNFVAPLVAFCSAWEMATIRRLWGRMIVRRPWWVVLASRVWVPVATGLLIMVVIYAAILAGLPSFALPGVTFPLLSAAGVICWALVGAAFGLVLPPLLALPVALLAPYLFLALPVGWANPIWLRHAMGYMTGCCDSGSVPDPRATHATLAVFAALGLVSLCVAGVRLSPVRQEPWRPAVAAGIAAVSVLGALVVAAGVRGLGHDAVRARPSGQERCADDVCMWPEDLPAHAINVAAWKRVRQAWTGLGLPTPPVGIGPTASGGRLPIAVSSTSEEQGEIALAKALPLAMRGCLNATSFEAVRGRNADLATFGDLSFMVLMRLGVNGASAVATGFQLHLPPPDPAQAPSIWNATSPCLNGS